MEILDLKFGGITIGVWLGVVGLWYFGFIVLQVWLDQRARKKELDEIQKNADAVSIWKPNMVSGMDCGKWVRRDGGPL